MTDQIRIIGIEVFAHHGVFADEKETGQAFLIDVLLEVDLSGAAEGDDLKHTIDYGDVAQRTHDLVSGTRFDLIEKVAGEVALMLLADERVRQVEVTVHKPGAPIAVPFRDVSVTIRRP